MIDPVTKNASCKKKRPLSRISIMHYYKLVFRSLLFLAALIVYIINRIQKDPRPFGGYERQPLILSIIWIVFVIEMILRFFPSSLESMGCQKQFASNYKPTGRTEPNLHSWKSTLAIVVAWFLLNGIIGSLYYLQIIDEGILLLISLAYSVCDMICILFFCPFQTWFMKNKCCTTCRIYNWDYAMMFTPLVFIKNVYALSLLAIALALLVAWEVAVRRHPEHFSERTNGCLSCVNCQEKLCHHKKQLRQFLKDNRKTLQLKGNQLFGREEKLRKGKK